MGDVEFELGIAWFQFTKEYVLYVEQIQIYRIPYALKVARKLFSSVLRNSTFRGDVGWGGGWGRGMGWVMGYFMFQSVSVYVKGQNL
jgi:hypothetical protein